MADAAVMTAPARPTRQSTKTLKDLFKDPDAKVGDMLNHREMQESMLKAMPKHINGERMLKAFTGAIQRTPDLLRCNKLSLIGAFMTCANLGLEPNTPLQHAYLIPFKRNKNVGTKDQPNWQTTYDVQLIIGYRGYVDLARRSGDVAIVHADVIRPGDYFEFGFGTGGTLRHVPAGLGVMPSDDKRYIVRPPKDMAQGQNWMGAYAYVRFKDGSEMYEVMPWSEVMKIRNGTEAYRQAMRARPGTPAHDKAPWIAHEDEMSKKTAFRRLSKWLPLSAEAAAAAAIDEASDRFGVDFSRGLNFDDGAPQADLDTLAIEHSDEQPLDTSLDAGQDEREAATVEQAEPQRQQQTTTGPTAAQGQGAAAPQGAGGSSAAPAAQGAAAGTQAPAAGGGPPKKEGKPAAGAAPAKPADRPEPDLPGFLDKSKPQQKRVDPMDVLANIGDAPGTVELMGYWRDEILPRVRSTKPKLYSDEEAEQMVYVLKERLSNLGAADAFTDADDPNHDA